MICAYKLVTIRCKLMGLGGKVESLLMTSELEIFLKFFKQVGFFRNFFLQIFAEKLVKNQIFYSVQ